MDSETIGVLWFAFTAGAATFFAPCSYPLLPGYVAYYLGDRGPSDRSVGRRLGRAAIVGATVSLGFAFVYGAFGGAMVVAGSRALADVVLLELVVGSVVIALGLGMALGRSWSSLLPSAIRRSPSSTPLASSIRLPERRRSGLGYLLFGVVYATAAAGCTVPLFVGIAGFALRTGPTETVAIVGSYVAGMSVLMIGLTVLAAIGRDAILRRLSRNVGRIRRAAGLLLVAAGIAQLYLFFFRFGGRELLGFP